MINPAQALYDEHHSEFELWFSEIHPNHCLTFDWIKVWDTGWYEEGLAQGAWIAWLELTGKNAKS